MREEGGRGWGRRGERGGVYNKQKRAASKKVSVTTYVQATKYNIRIMNDKQQSIPQKKQSFACMLYLLVELGLWYGFYGRFALLLLAASCSTASCNWWAIISLENGVLLRLGLVSVQ